MNVEIRDLEKLLSTSNTVIKGYTTKDLVEPGENYGSLLVSVSLTIEDSQKSTSDLQLVAKLLPKNDWIKELFDVQVTFKREIALYETIVPTLLEFLNAHECTGLLNFLPKFYAGRINLNSESTVVDNDAVLLLENLKASGFLNVNRRKGFNFNETQLIVKTLATFHAVVIALKLMKPESFREFVEPHVSALDLFSVSEKMETSVLDNICNTVKSTEKCIPLIGNIRRAFNAFGNWTRNKPSPKEPFACITHNDLWVNNIMIKFMEDTPMECKLLDFQTMEYGSPCNDLVFFLYTSVKAEVLDKHFNHFRDYYYSVFTNILESLKCDIAPFSYDLFLQEFEEAAKAEFKHIVLMLTPVLNLKSTKPIEEANEDDFMTTEFDSEEYKKRVPEVVLDFFEKGWI